MVWVERLDAESRRRESAADVFRKRPAWPVARASAKPPMKRWRAEVSATPFGRLEAMGVSLSVARMSRASMPKTKAMGDSERVVSVDAPSSWVRTRWRRVRVSTVRAGLMEEKDLAVALVAAEEADAAACD